MSAIGHTLSNDLYITTPSGVEGNLPASAGTSPAFWDSDSSVASSRRSSVSTGSALSARASTAPQKSHRKGSPTDSICAHCHKLNCGIRKHQDHTGKNAKERNHRTELQAVVQNMQDILQNYGSLLHQGKTQSAGNATSSGLDYNKLEIQSTFTAMSVGVLNTRIQEALSSGLEDEFYAELNRHVERWHETGDVFAGTFMYSADARCEKAENGGRCVVHDTEDWAVCRRTRAEATFKRNREDFVATCNPFKRTGM